MEYTVTFMSSDFVLITTVKAETENEAVNKAGNKLLATYGWSVYEASTEIMAIQSKK
jgi:hypothetical protein